MNDFKTTLAIGKKGESEVVEYFRNKRHMNITDVSDDKAYQHKDIDLLLENPEGQRCSVEIKTDNRMAKTGNLFFEIGSNRQTGYYDGWIKYCEADYICFFDNVQKAGYVLDWKTTKPLLKKESRYVAFQNRIDGCISEGYLLPVAKANRLDLIKHRFQTAA